ncbi:MAG: hypothetical protein CVT88_03110 [Candidatus Altiarchaeales archaeon HGW-Altiarchaeales-1]|nr:MAG: hypothetical protein CVT89_08235 [Candidatus Altiarchaeales archaeon HGW-Altiarchaeales-2]PKP60417.1 MAG: hypothetical protein CVT88_03110 [Candidatus Altiarchaeales archaeon HGW-Altiarchaeales-1]
MITAQRKPMEEIVKNLTGKKKVLVVGCNGCTAFHRVGGQKQVGEFAKLLKINTKLKNLDIEIIESCVEQQCGKELVEDALNEVIKGCDAVISLACGAGVQQIAEIYEKILVYPANDTFLVGIENRKEEKLVEVCRGCGDCILGETVGICPKTRCRKGLLNGPCAGVHDGLCELSTKENKIPCAWIEICNKMVEMGMKDKILEIRMP